MSETRLLGAGNRCSRFCADVQLLDVGLTLISLVFHTLIDFCAVTVYAVHAVIIAFTVTDDANFLLLNTVCEAER